MVVTGKGAGLWLMIGLLIGSPAYARAPRMVHGLWKYTEHFAAAGQQHDLHMTVCYQGRLSALFAAKQHGEVCQPPHIVSAGGNVFDMTDTCTQQSAGGAVTMHSHAHFVVAPDGRSFHGTAHTIMQMGGMTMPSPAVAVESRYIGACPGR